MYVERIGITSVQFSANGSNMENPNQENFIIVPDLDDSDDSGTDDSELQEFEELSPVEIVLPEREWEVIDEEEKVIHCSVCQQSDIGKKYVTPNKCTHVFHIECVGDDRRCPLCRVQVSPYKFLNMDLNTPEKPSSDCKEIQTDTPFKNTADKEMQTDTPPKNAMDKSIQTKVSFGVKKKLWKRSWKSLKNAKSHKKQGNAKTNAGWKVTSMCSSHPTRSIVKRVKSFVSWSSGLHKKGKILLLRI